MIAWLDTSTWFNEQVGIVAAGFALVFMIGCAVQFWLPQIARVGERFGPWKVAAAS
jgi:hypothetical protein